MAGREELCPAPAQVETVNVSEVVPAVSVRIRSTLLMEVLHGSGAKNDEKSHPKSRPLKRNHFVGFTFFGVIIRFKNDRIEEEGQQAEHEEEFDKEHRKVLGVMLDS